MKKKTPTSLLMLKKENKKHQKDLLLYSSSSHSILECHKEYPKEKNVLSFCVLTSFGVSTQRIAKKKGCVQNENSSCWRLSDDCYSDFGITIIMHHYCQLN